MPVTGNIKGTRFAIVETQHVDRSQVAARVIKERVFAAWVSRIDSVVFRSDFAVFTRRARMPSVKSIVELRRGVGTPPRGLIENLPQMTDIHVTVDARITASLKADFAFGLRSRSATLRMNSSLNRTELFEFCPETVW